MIAIIAILAAILFPVFARARENARRASCQSNLKQIGLGILQYVQDYDEKYPSANDNGSNAQFVTTSISGVGQYASPGGGELQYGRWRMATLPYTKSSQIYACPSSHSNSPNSRYTTNGVATEMPSIFNYGVNTYIIGVSTSASLAQLQQTSLLPMVADSGPLIFNDNLWRVINANHQESPQGWTSTNAIIEGAARHLNGSNLLYADGHVKFAQQSAMTLDPARSSQSNNADKWKIPLRPQDDRVQ